VHEPVKDVCGWVELAGKTRRHPALTGTQSTDWAVIGGGFTGLAAARRLAELHPNDRIVLLDGKRIGEGASGRNSGFVVANESISAATIANADSRDAYLGLHALDLAGVKGLRVLVQHHNITCQWEDTPSIHAATLPRNFNRLRDHAAGFKELGIDAEMLGAEALHERLGTGYYQLGLQSRGGALVQPAMLAKGLAETLPKSVEMFENTPVTHIAHDGTITLATGVLKAAKIIVAVNAFFPRLGYYRDRMFPLALTASLTRPLSNEEISAAPFGILSTRPLGATLRLTQDRRLMIRNTAEFRPSGINATTLAARRKTHIVALRQRFPWLEPQAVECTWSGNIAISRNAQPVFGAVSENVFAAGCYNAAGVARGSSMGRLIAEFASGGTTPLLSTLLSLAPPSKMPPRPFSDLGILARLAIDSITARKES